MLYVALAFWLIIGGGVFLIALGGGPGGARATLHSEGALANRVRVIVIALVFAFGLAVPIVISIANAQDKARQGPGGITLTKAETTGRLLFARSCALCHTLKAAAAVGHVGPVLDLDPAVVGGQAAFVLNAIQTGRARGLGNMPAGIYTGQQAKDVAEFVVRVAGQS